MKNSSPKIFAFFLISLSCFSFWRCGNEAHVCFTADKMVVNLRDTVHFSNCSTDANTYSWSFGDDANRNSVTFDKNPSHVYYEIGTYKVILSAWSKKYQRGMPVPKEKSHSINIEVVNFGCMDPASVNYNPSATRDDGSCKYNSYTYFYLDAPYTTVNLYIDSSAAEVFQYNYYLSSPPNCNNSYNGAKKIKLDVGTHSYVANFYKNSSLIKSKQASFEVPVNSCLPLLLK